MADGYTTRWHRVQPIGYVRRPGASDPVPGEFYDPNQETIIKSLSGGNIQKLVMARELARNPRVLIAAQPTRGVDIGATEYIHQRLLDQRAKGTATLLISEDLDEILALSDRIAVIYEGEIVGVVERDEADVERLGLMMAGVRPEQAAAASEQV